MTHIESSAPRDGENSVSHATPPASEPAVAVAEVRAAGTAETAVPEGAPPATEPARVREIGGRKDGPEPTRFGDWERNGRCVDF